MTTKTKYLAACLLLWSCGTTENEVDTGGGDEDGLNPGSGGAEGGGATTTGSVSAEGGGTGTTGPAVVDEDGGGTASPVKLDVTAVPDAGEGQGFCQPGDGGKGEPEFSFLWAANSSEGTISKIDTQTVTEVGRYIVRPDSAGSPSRTSVSLSGHVAVANRNGGITKVWATEEFCEDTNGMAGIQTSGNNVALPWDTEECRAWHIPFDYDSQRPIAWAPGDFNSSTCTWENEMLWTAGRYGQNMDEVILIDGDAGVVVDTVSVTGLKADQFGLYGGAVDSEGNFWTTGWATGNHLVRVRLDDLSVTVWDGPSSTGMTGHWYGMTVDVNGYVWNCASRLARFDPMTEAWTVSPAVPVGGSGCMADGDPDGLLWVGGSGVVGVDRETFAVVSTWPTPTSYGVSIDFFGNVWAVNGNGAHRVDPVTGTVTSYNGLTGAYTYSDMTGFALNSVGGGAPSG
ncbi:MAG: hypothetical protein AAF721_18385 [Myxococcota bacterium]